MSSKIAESNTNPKNGAQSVKALPFATMLRPTAQEEILIDDHERIFGKKAEDVIYTNVVCDRCHSRIDEFHKCACGAGGD